MVKMFIFIFDCSLPFNIYQLVLLTRPSQYVQKPDPTNFLYIHTIQGTIMPLLESYIRLLNGVLTLLLDSAFYDRCHSLKCEMMSQSCSKHYHDYSSPLYPSFPLAFYSFFSRKTKYTSHYVAVQT